MSTSSNNESGSAVSIGGSSSLSSRLRSAVDFTFKKFLSSFKFSLMKKLCRPAYDKDYEGLKVLHDQLKSQLHSSIKEYFNEVCEQYSIDLLLESLENIVKNQDNSQPSWRPSENPEEDLRDHIYPVKMRHKQELEILLNKLRTSNEELENAVVINNAEIMHLDESNQQLHAEFTKIVDSLTGSNLQNLQRALMNEGNSNDI